MQVVSFEVDQNCIPLKALPDLNFKYKALVVLGLNNLQPFLTKSGKVTNARNVGNEAYQLFQNIKSAKEGGSNTTNIAAKQYVKDQGGAIFSFYV